MQGNQQSKAVLNPRGRFSRRPIAAFSLAELLVAVALMSVIIIALYAVFNQTQKALRASVAQVDVSGSARAVLDMIGRDLEQLSPLAPLPVTNVPNIRVRLQPVAGAMAAPPVVQEEVDGTPLRTNLLQEIFFLTRENKDFFGTGYAVLNATNGIGTLSRFSYRVHAADIVASTSTSPKTNDPIAQFQRAANEYYTKNRRDEFHPVADGIIHFRLQAYDALGNPWAYGLYPAYYPTNYTTNYSRVGTEDRIWLKTDRTMFTNNNVTLTQDVRTTSKNEQVRETSLLFMSNALPAYIDLELGVIEPEALKQYNALRDSPGDVSYKFLRKQSAKVQLFRKRIPIRIATQ